MTVGAQGGSVGWGGAELFPTTLWGDIQSAQGRSQPALARLCERYREPLFVYLQRRGLNYHEASDAVQGFFAHLLEREFLLGRDPGKGRFRAFLVQSVQNFVNDQQARATTKKRGGGIPHLALTEQSETCAEGDLPASQSTPPDRAYEQAWGQAVLRNALTNWRAERAKCADRALTADAVEQLIYAEPDAPSYRQLSLQLGVAPSVLKMQAYRLRLRLAYWIREEIRQTLAPGESVDEELSHLIRVLRGE